jgi:hypothetical protein
LKLLSRDLSHNVIVSAKCLFLEKLGQEVNGGEEDKQKRASNVKFFKSPWRNNNIQTHVTEQHELKFAEYKELIPEARNIFLPQMTPLFNP